MSDGPHRSLPMKRKWHGVAERADKRAFGIDEIATAMIPALAGDCRDEMTPGFVDRIRGVFEEQESLLIKDNIKARVEALRSDAGSGIGRRLIENVVRISSDDAAGVLDLIKAMTSALTERAARCNRQIEEHYLRESTVSRANNVRSRLEQATMTAAFDDLARQILKLNDNRPARSSAKRVGLEEGPNIR